MTETQAPTATPTAVPTEPTEPVKSVFSDVLAKTNLPPEALAPIESKLVEAFNLIVENNKRIAQVNAAKESDPNNEENLDRLWRLNATTDTAIAAIEPQYQALIDESEKLLKQMRELAKKHIQPSLSEDEAKNVRKLVNESAPTIVKAKQSAADMAQIADTMLALPHINAPIEGGIISLLPEIESLKQTRGRKAAASGEAGKIYMTRVVEILLDGKSSNKLIGGEMKGKFNYAAGDLSEMWGANLHPANLVSAEELETAYWEALDLPWRSKKNTELPESFSFEFSKTIRVQNKNDDSFTELPKTVKITVLQPKPVAAETPKAETPAEKVEAKPETAKVEAPAKTEAPKRSNPTNVQPKATK